MNRPSFVLGVHPHTRGFGWIVFENPLAPYDWGMVTARVDKNAICLKKLEKILARYQPETLVLEVFEREHSRRRGRISRLGRSMVALAHVSGVEIAIYDRKQMKAHFAGVGAVTRQEIAEAVGRQLEMLRHRLPAGRKLWESAPELLALFMAAALVLTHYAYAANELFESLSDVNACP